MTNHAARMLDGVKSAVFDSQKGKIHRLEGKYVERDGQTYLVKKVNWRSGVLIASNVKTPLADVSTFTIRSFLSKHVKEVDGDEK